MGGGSRPGADKPGSHDPPPQLDISLPPSGSPSPPPLALRPLLCLAARSRPPPRALGHAPAAREPRGTMRANVSGGELAMQMPAACENSLGRLKGAGWGVGHCIGMSCPARRPPAGQSAIVCGRLIASPPRQPGRKAEGGSNQALEPRRLVTCPRCSYASPQGGVRPGGPTA